MLFNAPHSLTLWLILKKSFIVLNNARINSLSIDIVVVFDIYCNTWYCYYNKTESKGRCLSIYLFIYLSIYLSIYLFIILYLNQAGCLYNESNIIIWHGVFLKEYINKHIRRWLDNPHLCKHMIEQTKIYRLINFIIIVISHLYYSYF